MGMAKLREANRHPIFSKQDRTSNPLHRAKVDKVSVLEYRRASKIWPAEACKLQSKIRIEMVGIIQIPVKWPWYGICRAQIWETRRGTITNLISTRRGKSCPNSMDPTAMPCRSKNRSWIHWGKNKRTSTGINMKAILSFVWSNQVWTSAASLPPIEGSFQ